MGELCLAESKHCMRIAKKFSRYLKEKASSKQISYCNEVSDCHVFIWNQILSLISYGLTSKFFSSKNYLLIGKES